MLQFRAFARTGAGRVNAPQFFASTPPTGVVAALIRSAHGGDLFGSAAPASPAPEQRRTHRCAREAKPGRIPPEALSALLRGLEDLDDHVCCTAMAALAVAHLEALSPRLPDLLSGKRPKVAIGAIEIVQRAGSNRHFGCSAMLRNALRNPAWGVRSVAGGCSVQCR